MDQNLIRTDVLPDTLSSGLLLALAAFGLAVWAFAHWALRRYGSNKFNVWTRALIGVAPGTIAWWLALQAAARFVFFQTTWPLFLVALVGGAALEAVSAFYVHECARIPPRTAKILVSCRLSAVAAVLVMLAQPVLIGERPRLIHRRVLVLVDDSSSMNFVDKQMTDEERADVAKALGLDPLPELTRGEMIRRLLAVGGEASPLNTTARGFSVDVFRFGSGLKREPDLNATHEMDAKEQMFRSTTDIARALELALEEVPAEEITGVILFTDGRHNGDSGIGSVARRFGSYGIRVDAVVVGGTVKPFDLAIAAVDAPESVFEGDKVRFTVRVNATNANGRKAKLTLKNDSFVELDSKEFEIEGDDWTQEVKFSDLPNERGLFRYTFSLTYHSGELFRENNTRDIDVAVSDDRTNVLLVDDRPRWEYRYLRNLFYGRDKSVHLQDWIVHPDTIAGLEADPLPPASADREFGDSAAGAFPTSLQEWRKFDIIILGDLGEDVLTPDVVDNITQCVEKRGALLVLISGSENMPYTIRNAALRELMSVDVDPTDASHRDAPEADFRVALAPAGRGHPVMSQSSSAYESEELWNGMPDFHWRLPIKSVKEGSEVLAYARLNQGSSQLGFASDAESIAASLEEDAESALRRLERLREEQNRNALIATATRGKGRVLMLMTDSLWRLRSKLGDQQHHRFWGQVMRWGAGERLRVGDAHVRLGTDQLRYGAGEPVKLYARVLDAQFKGVENLPLSVLVRGMDGGGAMKLPLTMREGSNGFYETEIAGGLAHPGEYVVELLTGEAREALGSLYPSEIIETKLIVATAKRPAEDVDITATRDAVSLLARETKGKVYSPGQYLAEFAADHPVTDGDGTKEVRERTELLLWCQPPLFLFIVLLLTIEWIFRKRARLA